MAKISVTNMLHQSPKPLPPVSNSFKGLIFSIIRYNVYSNTEDHRERVKRIFAISH